MNSTGWIKLLRMPATYELLRNKNAFILLTIIALRARRTDDIVSGLKAGQAFIGDWANYGLTEQQYRNAKNNVLKMGFATFRATPRGTITTLTENSIYDINQDNQQRTEQRTNNEQTNEQTTTNKNDKNDKKNEKNIYSSPNQNRLNGTRNGRASRYRSVTQFNQSEQYPDCITI